MVLPEHMVNISIVIIWTLICEQFYYDVCECTDRTEGEIVIDCRVIPISPYNQVGETIIDDRTNMDW